MRVEVIEIRFVSVETSEDGRNDGVDLECGSGIFEEDGSGVGRYFCKRELGF